jgi:triosephosphate isomerase
MHGLKAALGEIESLARAFADEAPSADVLICPPATLITDAVRTASGRTVLIGGQDCHAEPQGAFTGDIAAEMLRDAGAKAVIVGHSERRQYHGESSELVATKARAARRASLYAIICVGETESERAAGRAVDVVTGQLRQSVPDGFAGSDAAIAYEPVWAIGTGRTPTAADIEEMHAAVREALRARIGPAGAEMRILYGGSVKPDNAPQILALKNVDGALVGGASLKATDFLRIVRSAPKR